MRTSIGTVSSRGMTVLSLCKNITPSGLKNHHKKVARQNINVELLGDSENFRALNKQLDAAIKNILVIKIAHY